jgi:hypothetical protein
MEKWKMSIIEKGKNDYVLICDSCGEIYHATSNNEIEKYMKSRGWLNKGNMQYCNDCRNVYE